MKFDARPVSAFLEASATAVGVGMVLGGFAAACLGSMLGVLYYLTERDRKLGRPLPPHPFRRSGSDGEDPG